MSVNNDLQNGFLENLREALGVSGSLVDAIDWKRLQSPAMGLIRALYYKVDILEHMDLVLAESGAEVLQGQVNEAEEEITRLKDKVQYLAEALAWERSKEED